MSLSATATDLKNPWGWQLHLWAACSNVCSSYEEILADTQLKLPRSHSRRHSGQVMLSTLPILLTISFPVKALVQTWAPRGLHLSWKLWPSQFVEISGKRFSVLTCTAWTHTHHTPGACSRLLRAQTPFCTAAEFSPAQKLQPHYQLMNCFLLSCLAPYWVICAET